MLRLLLGLVALLMGARVCCAQLASIQSIDQELQRQSQAGGFSGAVLIAKGDRILLDRAYANAAYPVGAANSGRTRFRIGSLTKQFTAAVILKLREEGKLSLDDPVCRYLQPCPDSWEHIKLSHLLSHTSGIASYTALPSYGEIKAHPLSTAGLIDLIESLPVPFAPGSKFDYSDSGYAILGAVIERAAGRSYSEVLKVEILDPLGMNDTGYGNPPISADGAVGYSKAPDGLHAVPVVDASVAFSSAGMYSTTQDLLRWVRALMADRVLSAQSRREMFTAGREDFGYGWIVPRNTSPVTYLHLGETDGFESAIFVLPDLGVTSIVLSNVEGTDVQPIAAHDAIAGAYAEYEGEYSLPELKKILRVFLKGATLTAQTGRGPTLPLDYVSGDAFVALRGTESEVRIEFKRDEAGQIAGVEAQQFGNRFSGTRRPAPGTRAGSDQELYATHLLAIWPAVAGQHALMPARYLRLAHAVVDPARICLNRRSRSRSGPG